MLLASLAIKINGDIFKSPYIFCRKDLELPLLTYFLSGLHSGGMRPLVLHCLCALNPQSEMRGKGNKNYSNSKNRCCFIH